MISILMIAISMISILMIGITMILTGWILVGWKMAGWKMAGGKWLGGKRRVDFGLGGFQMGGFRRVDFVQVDFCGWISGVSHSRPTQFESDPLLFDDISIQLLSICSITYQYEHEKLIKKTCKIFFGNAQTLFINTNYYLHV